MTLRQERRKNQALILNILYMHTKKIIFIIAQDQFRDEELFDTKKVLDEAGFRTQVASKTREAATGKLGAKVQPDLAIHEINPDELDALVFVGGSGSRVYFDDAEALLLAKTVHHRGKLVAAICAAPSILMNAGILQGMKATSHPSEAANLKTKGAIYTGKPVEVENSIITGRDPEAATDFGKAIAERLAK